MKKYFSDFIKVIFFDFVRLFRLYKYYFVNKFQNNSINSYGILTDRLIKFLQYINA
jgi:hypothetical protein